MKTISYVWPKNIIFNKGFALRGQWYWDFAGSPTIIIAVPQLQYMKDPEHYFLEVDDYEEYRKQKGIETTY